MLSLSTFVSQPSATTPLQSARSTCVQESMAQVPPSHVVVVFEGAVHATPQAPQSTSVSSDVSQPAIDASQSPHRASQTISQVPIAHVALAFGKGPHGTPHPPQ